MASPDEFDVCVVSVPVKRVESLTYSTNTLVTVEITDKILMNGYNIFLINHSLRRNLYHNSLSTLPDELVSIIDTYLPFPHKTQFDPTNILYQDKSIIKSFQYGELSYPKNQVFHKRGKCNLEDLFAEGNKFYFTIRGITELNYNIEIYPICEITE